MSYYGLTETRTYNAQTLQLTRMTTVNGGTTLMDMQYLYSATQNNGRITGSVDHVVTPDPETASYTYDALNRLKTVSAGGYGESISYDGFGNVTGMNGAAVWTHDPATNRKTGTGWSYDGNGNATASPVAGVSADWDVENRPLKSASASYDPFGKLITGDDWTFYSVQGQRLGEYKVTWDGNGVPTVAISYGAHYNTYFGGKLIRRYTEPVATDRLGSVRSGIYTGTAQYRAFGDERTNTTNGFEKFGTYVAVAPGQDYADQRWYMPGAGMFWSADPAGLSAVNSANPGSWNRYAYAGGDPINFNDPTGHQRDAGICRDEWRESAEYTELGGLAKRWYIVTVCDEWGGGGQAGGGAPALTNSPIILAAERGAGDRLFDPDCAGLFLSPDENTAQNRQALSMQLDNLEDEGGIRQIGAPNGTSPNIAGTAAQGGFIYFFTGGAFFTGKVNGDNLGGVFADMSLSTVQQAMVIHEYLHWTGVAGADDSGQNIKLPNGDTVKGSTGLSEEVREKCFK